MNTQKMSAQNTAAARARWAPRCVIIFWAMNDATSAELAVHQEAIKTALVKRVFTTEGKYLLTGALELSQLRDRAPTDAQWGAVLRASTEFGSRPGDSGRLPNGYACLGSGVTLPSAEVPKSGTGGAGNMLSASWQRCKGEFLTTWEGASWTGRGIKVLGWVLAAFAGLLDAPFWFAALNNVVNLRGSGPKPATADTASAVAIVTALG